ncbi:hypothetical protein HDU67_000597 [Dinochytrium kinnereticum]|nr:hypothetical protein HDU67_000597 [Dinochytrium kinnereticum]
MTASTMAPSPPGYAAHIPPTIILLRHGEKLSWPHGAPPEKGAKALYVDNHLLSGKGQERSHALVGYFLHRHEIQSIFSRAPLAAIFAQGVDHDGKGKSQRPRQTVEPLAWALAASPDLSGGKSLTFASAQTWKCPTTSSVSAAHADGSDKMSGILIEYKKKDVMKMVDRILRSGEFSGKTVIVSWSHQQLPALAVALGVSRSMVPHKWGKRYDVTWVLEPVAMKKGSASSSRPRMNLIQMPQRLVYGDQDAVFEVGEGFEGDEDEILGADDEEED